MNLLSIQSHVAYGHVGNSAAVFALQRLGIEVWPVHTVQFSNHPGYGGFKGQVFDAAAIREVIDGIEARGVLPQCDGILSGYMGSAQTGEAILDAVTRVKRANAGALYCCDPVIGDSGRGIYVQAGLPEFIAAKAVAAADIVTPNHFELQHLAGARAASLSSLRDALQALHRRGPRVILVTSVEADDAPADSIDVIASECGNVFRLRTPRLNIAANGAGDAIAALFLAHYLRERSAAVAMSRAVSSIFGILKRTAEARSREMLLVEAQEELVQPGRMFEPERMG